MRIDSLSVMHFKNIEEASVAFSPKLNCFFGNNGMGKTNLLDALYYLSFCKSFTNLPDSQLIRHQADFAVLQAEYFLHDKTVSIYSGLRKRQRKSFKRNKKEYEKLSDHIGLLPLVMVSPADTDLIQGLSEERRKFVDLVIAQYDKEYLRSLIAYNKALTQRNALLKQEEGLDMSLLLIFEEQMAWHGMLIFEKRKLFVEQFKPIFQAFYSFICADGEQVDLVYDSQLHTANLAALLEEKRGRDQLLGHSTQGIHKDDFQFLLGDHLMKKVGSQGQNKTYLIALKLAQFDFLKRLGTTPILLLDDIFDKLDSHRVEQIIKLVLGDTFGQVFITDTNRAHLDDILSKVEHDYALFYVEEGTIQRMEEGEK